MSNKAEKLFEDFIVSDKNTWIEKALEKLKNKDFNALQTNTYEGITLNPFYTSEESVESQLHIQNFSQDWKTRQRLSIENIEETITKIHTLKNKGIDELHFYFQKPVQLTELEKIVTTAQENNFTIILEIPNHSTELIKTIKQINFEGEVHFDFIANFTATGILDEENFKWLAELLKLSDSKNIHSFCINTQNFQNAGANAVQELAFGLSLAVEYIDKLTNLGLDKNLIFKSNAFSMAIGSNYFMEIAKFRAIRILWDFITKSFDTQSYKLNLHAETSLWNKSALDKYNNMLRSTTEAMSAVIGGVNALTVQPFDVFLTENDPFSERIAKNVSVLLKEEAYLNKIVDASKGSYFIEEITEELTNKAWTLFQEVETKGGFIAAFKSGFISREIYKIAEQKKENLKNEKDTLVGVNKYPNSMEESVVLPKCNNTIDSKLPLLKLQRVAESLEK